VANVAESRNDEPLRMRYRSPRQTAAYRVRVVYAGEDVPHDFRLTLMGSTACMMDEEAEAGRAGGIRHPRRGDRGRELTLEFERRPGIGGAGRAVQLAEVWLMRR
jgi:hypothetical protein